MHFRKAAVSGRRSMLQRPQRETGAQLLRLSMLVALKASMAQEACSPLDAVS